MRVLHPADRPIVYPRDYPKGSEQFVNNLSLVMRFEYKDSSMLFGGDVYSIVERQIVHRYGNSLQSDVFKVGHHGDDDSSCRPYRQAITPKIAVMMSDKPPDEEVFENYARMGIDTYSTYQNGSVCVSTAGDGTYAVLTERDGKKGPGKGTV